MREQAPIKNLLKYTMLAATVGAGACDRGPAITDGEVYQKEHIVETSAIYPWSNDAIQISLDRQREVLGSAEPTHQVKGMHMEFNFNTKPDKIIRSERFKVSLAQCPTEEPRSVDRIEAECKTVTFNVSGNVFQNLKLGQHADLKPQK